MQEDEKVKRLELKESPTLQEEDYTIGSELDETNRHNRRKFLYWVTAFGLSHLAIIIWVKHDYSWMAVLGLIIFQLLFILTIGEHYNITTPRIIIDILSKTLKH